MLNDNISSISLNKEVSSLISREQDQAQSESKQEILTSICHLDAAVQARTSILATDQQDEPVTEDLEFNTPRMAPAVGWDIAWNVTIGSVEVPPTNRRQKSTITVRKAPRAELLEAPISDGLL